MKKKRGKGSKKNEKEIKDERKAQILHDLIELSTKFNKFTKFIDKTKKKKGESGSKTSSDNVGQVNATISSAEMKNLKENRYEKIDTYMHNHAGIFNRYCLHKAANSLQTKSPTEFKYQYEKFLINNQNKGKQTAIEGDLINTLSLQVCQDYTQKYKSLLEHHIDKYHDENRPTPSKTEDEEIDLVQSKWKYFHLKTKRKYLTNNLNQAS